jgi:hypothetical protein
MCSRKKIRLSLSVLISTNSLQLVNIAKSAFFFSTNCRDTEMEVVKRATRVTNEALGKIPWIAYFLLRCRNDNSGMSIEYPSSIQPDGPGIRKIFYSWVTPVHDRNQDKCETGIFSPIRYPNLAHIKF